MLGRLIWLPLLLVAVASTATVLADNCGCAQPSANCCKPTVQYVEKTICCPTWVTETRTVKVCEYRNEQREREVTVYQRVPETKTVTRTVCDMVPEQRTKTVSYTVCKPVWTEKTCEYTVRIPICRDVKQEYTVMVPRQEIRTASRTVCKRIPVTETRTVRVDEGCWETQAVEVPCSPCRGCHLRKRCCGECSCCDPCAPKTRTVCKRVWVPNIVEKEVDCTSYKLVREEVPCNYTVTVCTPETRTRTVRVRDCKTETRTRTFKVCHYEQEQRTREVNYTVCVAKTREVECQVTCCKNVPVTKTVSYTVCVPVMVEKEVQVRVRKMETKTIQVPVTCKRPHVCGVGKRRCNC